MRLRLRCGASYRLGDLQWCMVHVPENVLTVKDFAGHVARLLELNLHGGTVELPQILLDGFLVPHDEEVREVLRDDEVIDIEPTDGNKVGSPATKRQPVESAGHVTSKRAKIADAPVMALGWQPDSVTKPEAAKAPGSQTAAVAVKAATNGSKEAVEAAKALALATCSEGPPAAAGNGKDEGRGIFVGGLPLSVDDKELRKHFERYGAVQDATVVMNQRTGKSKGFGFVEFNQPAAREKVLAQSSGEQIHGKSVEVKLRQVRGAKGKGGKGGKGDAPKGGNWNEGMKSGKGSKTAQAPQIRKQPPDESDSDEDESEEVKASAKAKPQPEALSEEMKQMAAMGLPVSFTASQQTGGEESEEDEEEEGDED
mmetsp:Transcript_36430/g.64720  ORF Transcript_36430/g.64720 Transcript_36430/m.64720 type:complete len:369 (-) Transcript_36430:84-1190(-)